MSTSHHFYDIVWQPVLVDLKIIHLYLPELGSCSFQNQPIIFLMARTFLRFLSNNHQIHFRKLNFLIVKINRQTKPVIRVQNRLPNFSGQMTNPLNLLSSKFPVKSQHPSSCYMKNPNNKECAMTHSTRFGWWVFFLISLLSKLLWLMRLIYWLIFLRLTF